MTATDSAARIRPLSRVITLKPVGPRKRAIGLAVAKQMAVASPIPVALGVDMTLLVKAASGLVQRFGAGASKEPDGLSSGY